MCLLMSVCVFSFSLGFISRNMFHFLTLMLIFELLTMGSFLLLSFFLSMSMNVVGCYIGVIFLVFCVSEAVMGLALLVSCSRSAASSAVKLYSFMGV